MITWVLDVSNHQDDFDVAKAAAEGYAVVLCKATEGVTFKDQRFERHIQLATAAGMVPGAYHFLRAGDGAAQARAFHARVVAAGGPRGWLIACDNEADASWDTTVAWAAEWRRLTVGHPFLMYTGAWWWGARGWPGSQLTPYLWHSRYTTGTGPGSRLYDQVPAEWWSPGYGGWGTATLLQFTSRAQVAGRTVDVSAFRGSVDDLRKLTTSGDDMITSEDLALIEERVTRSVTAGVRRGTWRDGYLDKTLPAGYRGGPTLETLSATLADLAARPTATVVLDDATRAAIVAQVAAEVASQLTPTLQVVQRIATQLGAAGGALGVLDDAPEAG